MIKKCAVVIVLILCMVISFGCDKKRSDAEPEFVLTYAENQEIGYPTTEGAVKFKELVEERTDGKVIVQIKAGGEFGTQQQMIEQLQFGGIDFARISISSICDELPKLNVLQMPFLYKDSDHMWRVLDSEIGDEFLKEFEKMGMKALSWYDGGVRSFYSTKKPIQSVEDMKGMTVRVQESDLMMDMIELLGGKPVTAAYSDVYSGLEKGQFDAAENNWSSYKVSEHYKVAKFYTIDEHTRVPEVQLISGRTWYQLPFKYRDIILECAKESADYQKVLWKESEENAKREVTVKGTLALVPDETEIAGFREKVRPLYEKYCSEYMNLIEQITKQANTP